MSTHFSLRKDRSSERAQAMVEFAIALPILLALLIGILEVGRLIFVYASVTNASRDASRYASAVGMADGTSYYKYQYCAGIRDVAKRSAFLLKLSDADITISYDHGTTGSTFDTCDGAVDTNVSINEGSNYDRATITIDTTYRPMVNLIPIPQRDIQSTSSRTILGIFELDATTSGGGWAPGSGPTRTKTPTPTMTPTVTATPTDTPTPKHTPKFATFTPSATATPGPATSIPTDTATSTITPTSTITSTATTTPTSTVTSTPFLCSGVSADAPTIKNKAMTTTITNPTSETLTISSVVVTWNWDSGASGGQALSLAQGQYGSTSLSSANLPNATGTHFFTLSPTITIPAGGTSSTFTFTFNKNYDFPTGRTSVSFNVSAPGCGSFPVTTSK